MWEFTKWLPLEDWLKQCGGRQGYNSDEDVNYINISVFSAYEQYGSSPTVEQQPMFGQINYTTSGSRPFLPPPLHTLSVNGNSDAHIYPIAVEESKGGTVQLLYFYSVLPLGQDGRSYTPSNSTSMVLLHVDKTINTSKQAWRLELGRTLPKAIPVEFQLPCGVECGAANGTLAFPLAMTRDHGEYTPALRVVITLQHSLDAANNHTEQFILGKAVTRTVLILLLLWLTVIRLINVSIMAAYIIDLCV